MDFNIVIQACGIILTFTEPALAVDFLRMASGSISPEQFTSLANLMHPDMADATKHIVAACVGTPA